MVFAAESFKLSDLSSSVSTSFIRNLRLNANARFSFYDTDEDGNQIENKNQEDI
mgnify:CR=1 FL=1